MTDPAPVSVTVAPVIDATLHRGWAAMINHSDTAPNVRCEWIRVPRSVAGGKTGHYRRRIVLPDKRVRQLPVGLLRDPFVEQEHWPFMVATRDILMGEEFLLNYGHDKQFILNFKHSTTPCLCD